MAESERLIQGYARALFSVAEAEGSLDEVEAELYQFAKTVEREADLREALTDPQLPAERKKAVIQELLGNKADRHTVSLLGFLVDQGRAKDLPRIIDALMQVAAERHERSVAELRSAILPIVMCITMIASTKYAVRAPQRTLSRTEAQNFQWTPSKKRFST